MDEENIVDANIPPVNDALLEKVKNTFFSEYFPIARFKEGVIFMSSQEIYNLFFDLYPNPLAFSTAQIAGWMHDNGFNFIKMKEMQYQWMLWPENL